MAFPRPHSYWVAEIKPHSLGLIPCSNTWISIPFACPPRRIRSWHHCMQIHALSPSPSSITCSLDTPRFLLLLPWAEPLTDAHSGKLNMVSHAARIAGKGGGSGSKRTQTISCRGCCQSGFACIGIIREGPDSFLYLIPTDKLKLGACLWFYSVLLASGQKQIPRERSLKTCNSYS